MAERKNEPKDGKLKQQKLAAFKPIHTAKSTALVLGFVGVLFFIVGAVLFAYADAVVEVSKRYDEKCEGKDECEVEFEIDEDMKEPIYLYYEMRNFYQNHRSFVKSVSHKQLAGKDLGKSDLSICDPVLEVEDLYLDKGKNYWNITLDDNDVANPCGLAARAYFNDTFNLKSAKIDSIDIEEDDIAWQSDVDYKFKYVDDYEEKLWTDVENVWMRVAAMPNFRKLWGRIEKNLDKGTYSMVIQNNYDVNEWDGEKHFVLSEINGLGGRNHFLGILYLAAGGLCCFFAMLFIVANLIRGDKASREPDEIRWR